MTMMLLSLLTVLGVIGFSTQFETCPVLPGAIPFDNPKFQGEWYVIARPDVPIASQHDAVCWKYQWHSDQTRMNLTILSDYKDGSSKEFSMRGRFIDVAARGAVLESVFKLGAKDPKYHGMVTQSIVATDYTKFAVHYACIEVYVQASDTFTRMVVAEVWSRTPTMDRAEAEALKAVAASSINMKPSDITDIDQSGCKH